MKRLRPARAALTSLATALVITACAATGEPEQLPSADQAVTEPATLASTQSAERLLTPVNPGGRVPLLPMPPAAERSYTVELARWGISNSGRSAVATTNGLQDALEWAEAQGYTTVTLPAGTYLIGKPSNAIYTAGVQLRSNMTLDLNGATMQMATHDKWNACLLAATGKTNVTIRNGTLRGDRDTHIFTPRQPGGSTAHDEGHLICVQAGSKRILVEDMTLERATGDGILLVGNRSSGSVRDITVRNSEFDTNRRQGISIVGAINVLVDNNEIHHTKGTSPQFGIDVESLSFDSRDITISNNFFHHNQGGDIVNTDGKNVLIEHNRFEEGTGSRNIDGPIVFWPRADQTIRHNTLFVRTGSVNGKVGIIGYSGRTIKQRTNPNLNWIYDNHCDGCGFYIYNTQGFRVFDNTFEQGYIAMRDVSDLVLLRNEVSYPTGCWPWRFLRVSGHAAGNTHNGQAKDLPMQRRVPWNGCWVR